MKESKMLKEFKPQWDKIPEKYKYVAQDGDGAVHAFVVKPMLYTFDWDLPNRSSGDVIFLGNCTNKDWENSLIGRPKGKVVKDRASDHIKQAVDVLLREIKSNLSPVIKDALNDNELFELISDEKLEVYLCGWLLAKGVPVKDLDLTKYGVKSLADQK